MTYLYNDFVRRIARSFDNLMSEIEAEQNFEYGIEFEIVICEILRQLLPQRYGVCRGYVVNEAGECAGDDIIIYEQMRYPTFRQEKNFARKEQVPIEAVFAYIEAKHTLNLQGKGKDKSSLIHALDQVAKVKELCKQRQDMPLTQINRRFYFDEKLSNVKFITPQAGWPKKFNPMYTAVFARRVRLKAKSSFIEDPVSIQQSMRIQGIEVDDVPDFLVVGRSNIALPAIPTDTEHVIAAPFATEEGTVPYGALIVDGIAFGVAIAHLFWALDNIELGPMPWNRILGNSLGR